MSTDKSTEHNDPSTSDDRGAILVMVLVMGVIGTLFVLPILAYSTTVLRASQVQSNKAESVEAAEGGTWVALSNQGALFDLCVGGDLVSSLDDVTTSCEVLATETLRDPAEMPFEVAVVQADSTLPVALTSGTTYTNPNSAADAGTWLTNGDWTAEPTQGKVWLPQLPVQSTSVGSRDTTMLPGAQDSNYSTCRVFFPGTFTAEIVLDGPTYFTSGVYSFTRPIVIKNGADVVVGNGTEIGCTTDFEAIAGASFAPNPLNMSGLGGTFVLGDQARISIDDTGSGDIRFAMNQRYVADEEMSVAASSNVSIVSVNGDHAPFVGAEALGDDLVVDGVINIPASTVGTDGNPLAAMEGYLPSVLTPKATAPAAPTVLDAVPYQRDRVGDDGPADRGRLTVSWTAPIDNGSPIAGYTATDLISGRGCSPAMPTLPDTSVQTSCTIDGLTNQSEDSGIHPIVIVTATNAAGTSAPSTPFDAERIDIGGGDQISSADASDPPSNVLVTNHVDGIAISWDTPGDDGGSPITGSRVVATDLLTAATFTCTAWWDETACVIPSSPGVIGGHSYDVDVVALQSEGSPSVQFQSAPASVVGHTVVLGGSPVPVQAPVYAPSERTPIIDLTSVGGDEIEVSIAGYVAVPQGFVQIGALSPSTTSIAITGGLVAADIQLGATVPALLDVRFANPVAQKRLRIVSTSNRRYAATSEAIIQVNRSGSLAINSWIVQ